MAHALLSPSAAERWLACTPSVRLGESYENTSSVYAEEGTLAHAYAETFLKYRDSDKGLKLALRNLKKDPLAHHYSEELEEHARQFADYVLSLCTGDHWLGIEQRLDLTDWLPEGFGTGDAIIVKDEVLNLVDLKYGRGVRVSAVENKQLMIYALGCVKRYGWVYEFHTIKLHIYQPRLDNISVWSISVEELLEWAETELKEKAEKAFKGEGETVPGEHCRFCPVKAECRGLSEVALELLREEYQDPQKLTTEEIGEILGKVDLVEMYLKAVREFAYGTLLGGGKIPGYKLVKGRPTRFITDTEALKQELLAAGLSEDTILVPVVEERPLLGLTALEKAVGKKTFETLASEYISRRDGKPTIAPETDKREEYSSIEVDFGDELE